MSAAFELPEELTIYTALETRDALLGWIATQEAKAVPTLDLSAAKVREVDGAGLQLLAALSHLEHPWRLLNVGATLSDAAQLLGLADWLNEHRA